MGNTEVDPHCPVLALRRQVMGAQTGEQVPCRQLPVIDEAVYRQVSTLLGPERASELLEVLRSNLLALAILSDEEVMAPGGLALIHRLKSEAGMMGLPALSAACGLVDASSLVGATSAFDVQRLRDAIGLVLKVEDLLGVDPFAERASRAIAPTFTQFEQSQSLNESVHKT